ncbi:MAG: hypothetical protein Q4C83_01230 [Candidatus Saccharibacteria bacterium]|nr:hypothetical protein [Candidatus Saccharibacteria bacterium]
MKKLSFYLPKVLTALIAIVALSFGIYYQTEANNILNDYSSPSSCTTNSGNCYN